MTVGGDDGCATDGSAQLLTLGGVQFAADLHVYRGQVIAAGDISFSANANGVEGASFITGDEIAGTSNAIMGMCGTGMERNVEADYFRLVS